MLYHIRGDFDSAHALVPHEGKCRHIHGHSYDVVVCFEIKDVDVFGAPGNMPVDFARLKGVVDAVLAARDHSLLLSSEGKHRFFGGHEPPTNLRITKGEPTAEYLAADIYGAISKEMPRLVGSGPDIMLLSVTVFETPDQGVTYSPVTIEIMPPPEVLARA
jgi:6-pyruvoyltetrahydropterin/6-carboxytetrahydropterin synthase